MSRSLSLEDFSHRVGDKFTISEQGLEAFPLTLAEAVPLRATWSKPGVRPPFSLIFLGANPCILPQRLYRFDGDLGRGLPAGRRMGAGQGHLARYRQSGKRV